MATRRLKVGDIVRVKTWGRESVVRQVAFLTRESGEPCYWVGRASEDRYGPFTRSQLVRLAGRKRPRGE